jgi:copper(I)-binding protein
MRKPLLLIALLLTACGGADKAPVVATDIVITEPPPGKTMRAAYLRLTNNTEEAITITRVTSDAFNAVSLHETSVEDGIARMRPIPRLEIPAGQTIELKRGGKHVMLMRPTGPATTMSLKFYDGEHLLLAVTAPLAPEPE